MGDVVVVLSGDERRLLDSLNRVIEREQKLRDAARDAGDAGERANRRVSQSTSDVERGIKSVVSQMAPWALGVAAVQAAYQGVAETIKDLVEQQKKSAQEVRAAGEGLAKLQQLAGGQPGRMASLGKDARDFFAAGGAKTLTEASETIFSLESGGLNSAENRKLIADLGGAVQNKAGAISAASKIQAAFGDKAGSLRDILAETFRASKESPDAPEALLDATARSATYAKEAGLDDEEALASVTMLSKEAGAAVAGTRLSGFLRVLSGPEAKGKGKGLLKRVIDRGGGMADVLDELERKGLTDHKAFAKAFGDDSEAFAGFKGLLGHKDELRALVQAERGAQSGDYVASVIASRQEDPDVALAHERQVTENREQLTREKEGRLRSMGEERALRHSVELQERGVPQFLARQVSRFEQNYQDDPLGANFIDIGPGKIPNPLTVAAGPFLAPQRYFDQQRMEEQERKALISPTTGNTRENMQAIEEHLRGIRDSNLRLVEQQQQATSSLMQILDQHVRRGAREQNGGLVGPPPGPQADR